MLHVKRSTIYRKLSSALRGVIYFFRQPVHPDPSRFSYQKDFIKHNFLPGDQILDIGSGGDPFPYATVLAERYIAPTRHRDSEFRGGGKPVVICDIHNLPFKNKQFDYIHCAHVLEHINNPITACEEIQRVGKAGYIECPNIVKDGLFAWARGMHKWHVFTIHHRLIFFEYSERQLDGIRSTAWYDLIFGPNYHPLQLDFDQNQDFFNCILEWENFFDVTLYRLDGGVATLSPACSTENT